MAFLLFFFGAAVGSFLNVVALRYEPDKFLFGRQILGRSQCPNCGRKLGWLELIPVLSFVFLRARCRTCASRIGLQYPAVEILSGLIFISIPAALYSPFLAPTYYFLFSFTWITVFLVLLLLSLIDLRFGIVPDEASLILAALGALLAVFLGPSAGPNVSFLGPYSLIFGFDGNIWLNRALGAMAAAAIFFFLILITRGRGMGAGDMKLAFSLGVVFGWPDAVIITAASFVVGSLAAIFYIFFRKLTIKSSVPFVPFFAAASFIVFYWGEDMARFYFGIFPLT